LACRGSRHLQLAAEIELALVVGQIAVEAIARIAVVLVM